MDIKVCIGLRIKVLRTHFNLTQEELAYKVDLDRTYINSVEKGKRNISIENIKKITKGFELTVFDFFNDDLFKEE